MKINFEPILYRTWAVVAVGGASLVAGGVKEITAAKADKRAKAEGDNLRRPFEKISDEYFQNKNLAEQQATSGLSVDEKGILQTGRERALGSSLDAITKTGANPNDIARLNDVYGQSLQNEAGQDAQLHLQNIQYLMGINKDLAGQKTTQWGVNEYQPFESKLKEIQDRRTAAQTNKNSAIDQMIGSASSIATGINSAVGGYKGNGSSDQNSGRTADVTSTDPGFTYTEDNEQSIDVADSVGDPSEADHPDLTINK